MEENDTYKVPLMVNVARLKISDIVLNIMIAFVNLICALMVMGLLFILSINIVKEIYALRYVFVHINDNLTIYNFIGYGILFGIVCGILTAYYQIFSLLLERVLSKFKDIIMIYRYDIFIVDDNKHPISSEPFRLYDYRLLSDEELGEKITKRMAMLTGSNIKFKIDKHRVVYPHGGGERCFYPKRSEFKVISQNVVPWAGSDA